VGEGLSRLLRGRLKINGTAVIINSNLMVKYEEDQNKTNVYKWIINTK
jgi:hypothetical protein